MSLKSAGVIQSLGVHRTGHVVIVVVDHSNMITEVFQPTEQFSASLCVQTFVFFHLGLSDSSVSMASYRSFVSWRRYFRRFPLLKNSLVQKIPRQWSSVMWTIPMWVIRCWLHRNRFPQWEHLYFREGQSKSLSRGNLFKVTSFSKRCRRSWCWR